MNAFSTSLHLSVFASLFPSRSQPISLCLSFCQSQPITGWLQVLNPRPHHQLAHYIAALNLPFGPSSFLFLVYSSLTFRLSFLFLFFTFILSFISLVFDFTSLLMYLHFDIFFCVYSHSFPVPHCVALCPFRFFFLSPLSVACQHPFLPPLSASPPPSFCKLLQLNCPFPACRQQWY